MKISVSVARKRSWGWRKKFLSDLLTDAVNEVEQEQRSELGENGAKPGRSPGHGGAARPLEEDLGAS